MYGDACLVLDALSDNFFWNRYSTSAQCIGAKSLISKYKKFDSDLDTVLPKAAEDTEVVKMQIQDAYAHLMPTIQAGTSDFVKRTLVANYDTFPPLSVKDAFNCYDVQVAYKA